MPWASLPPPRPVAAVALDGGAVSGTVVAVGGRVASGELLTEAPQACDRQTVDSTVRSAERRLDLAVNLGFEAAPAAVLEMLGDPPRRHLVERTVEVALQDPHRRHATHPAGRRVPYFHRKLLFGARPAALRRWRIRVRARCSRLMTVPTGTPITWAASA